MQNLSFKLSIISLITIISLSHHRCTFIQANTSIPHSTNTRRHNNINNSNSQTSLNSPPWNKSPRIDRDGFLIQKYDRIPGEWEHEANIGGKYCNLKEKVVIRQVPGDGNCLFHSITVALALVTNSTHIDMVGSKTKEYLSCDGKVVLPNKREKENKEQIRHRFMQRKAFSSRYNSKHVKHENISKRQDENHDKFESCHDDLHHLYKHSRYLREKAVEMLSTNPRRLLFLQGNEYLRAKDLVSAAAAQYDLTGEKYCELMRKESYWGGGPEIVALCNYLRRPIHVYELSHDCEEDENDEKLIAAAALGQEDKDSDDNDPTQRTRSSRRLSERSTDDEMSETNNEDDDDNKKKLPFTQSEFKLRRMACFGSPKYDKNGPLLILSADSRFPDVPPGKQMMCGNHFMVMFPEDLINEIRERERRERKRMKRRKKSADFRGGGSIVIGDVSGELKQKRNQKKYVSSGTRRRRNRFVNRNVFADSLRSQGILGVCRSLVQWLFYSKF